MFWVEVEVFNLLQIFVAYLSNTGAALLTGHSLGGGLAEQRLAA